MTWGDVIYLHTLDYSVAKVIRTTCVCNMIWQRVLQSYAPNDMSQCLCKKNVLTASYLVHI